MTIAEYLESKGMTLREFAEKLNVSVSVVHDWRIGRRMPRGQSIADIERVTDGSVTLADIVSVSGK